MGTVFSSLVLTVLPMVVERELGSEAHRQLVLVALALRIHERRTGAFPVTLKELEASMLPDLSNGPLDLAAVTYERAEAVCSVAYASDITDEVIEIAAQAR